MIRKREGFTLVELLVVVAIIIILAAILFPIFAKAREKAQQTRCLNNLKQMASAIEMYEDDYEGALMPVSIGSGAAGQESGQTINMYWGYMWVDLMDPYLKQLKKGARGGETKGQGEVLICPSAPTETAVVGSSWQMGKTYGYNPYISRFTTTSQLRYPSVTLRVTETADYVSTDMHNYQAQNLSDPGYKGGSWYAPVPNGKAIGYKLQLQAPGWHNGYQDCLWVDGHVSSITWERVMYTDRWQNATDPNVWCRLAPKEGYTE